MNVSAIYNCVYDWKGKLNRLLSELQLPETSRQHGQTLGENGYYLLPFLLCSRHMYVINKEIYVL